MDDQAGQYREQIDQKCREILSRQFLPPTQYTGQIEGRDCYQGNHQQRKPGTSAVLIVGSQIVNKSRKLSNRKQQEVHDPKGEHGAGQYTALPFFFADMQQKKGKYRHQEGIQEEFKIGYDAFRQ